MSTHAAGGDWYDVTVLDDTTIGITVGDVVGHGARAAAVMAQLRAVLSASLMETRSPVHALQVLSRFAQQVDGARCSTAICLVLDTGSGTVRWARAGHVPPLILLSDGSTRFLTDARGAILGLRATPPITEGTATLAAGDAVMLYTDGLVERRGENLDEGLDRLAGALAPHIRTPVGQLLAPVLDAALDRAGHPDDVAVVVARLQPAPLDRTRPAVPTGLSAVRREIDAWAALAALPDDQLGDLQLALGEALSNSVEHAYADGRGAGRTAIMRYRVAMRPDGGVQVETDDDGTWRPPPADPGYRGFGLRTISALTEDLRIDHASPGTRTRFVVPVPAVALPAPDGAPLPARPRPWTRPAGLEITTHDGVTVLRLTGEFDAATTSDIRARLLDAVAAAAGPVEIDTGDVTFLASAGVALLIDAMGTAEQARLRAADDGPAARILHLTGLLP